MIEKSSREGQAEAQSKTVEAACNYIEQHHDEFGLDKSKASECKPVTSAEPSKSTFQIATPQLVAALVFVLFGIYLLYRRHSSVFSFSTLNVFNGNVDIETDQVVSLRETIEQLESSIVKLTSRLDELSATIGNQRQICP